MPLLLMKGAAVFGHMTGCKADGCKRASSIEEGSNTNVSDTIVLPLGHHLARNDMISQRYPILDTREQP